MQQQQNRISEAEIYREVIAILQEITSDWDVGVISPETRLGDVLLESISAVYFIGDLQHRFELQDRLFEKLRTLGVKIADLHVLDVVNLILGLLSGQDVIVQ
jgi:acyl carrier protein